MIKLGFIGDIVGRPGRKIIKDRLKSIKQEYQLDCVVANTENASHGFGLTIKNGMELFEYGIDIFTGGNHTWDKKKDMTTLLQTKPVLRPANYPDEVVGSGVYTTIINDQKIAIINLMGMYGMPQVLNPFRYAIDMVEKLHKDGIRHIFVDFHAESTAEKRIMLELLKGKVSAICGTHTHIGTDDLQIVDDTFYVTDVGLTGCRDNIIGMDSKEPIQKALTGISGHFDIPKSCKTIMQMIILEIDNNAKTTNGFKLKIYNDKPNQILKI